MQEQNFEKQVKQKMEELSLTPSVPVWKKVEEQIRKKRERRWLLFWLPFAVLLLAGGVWLTTGNFKSNTTAKTNKEQENNIRNTNSTFRKQTIIKNQERPPVFEQNKEANNKEIDLATENFPQQNKTGSELKFKTASQSVTTKNSSRQNSRLKTIAVAPSAEGPIETPQKNLDKSKPSDFNDAARKPAVQQENKQPTKNTQLKEVPSYDRLTNNPDSVTNNISTKPGNVKSIDSTTKVDEKDSLSTQKNIAKTQKSNRSKWKFAIDAGIGRAGVNNGVGLFGGGAKSFETNAFAADLNFSSGGPVNASPGRIYRPPSEQEKSRAFSFALLVRKQFGKRPTLSAGLQYNFYSTQMQVGQSMNQDTMVDLNKSVNSFYSNSGTGFSTYHNKFHFISLPVALNFQILKNKPLDFHLGLSLQQLIATNALLYSSRSQVYYEDESAFNKTYLFSELGLEYSFPLSGRLSLKAGPRANFSHSRVIKESSGRHLFSYGFATQIIFSGK